MKEKHVKMKKSYNDKIFDIINVLLMCILVVIFVWPLWFIVIASFSDPNEVWLGHVLLLPKGFTTLPTRLLPSMEISGLATAIPFSIPL